MFDHVWTVSRPLSTVAVVSRKWPVAALAALALALPAHSVQAHVVCGDRVFPATLTMDDPGVGNELSLPTISLTPTPSSQNAVYGYEWDKTITEDLGFAVNGNYARQFSPAGSLSGWDNLTLTLKDEHPCAEEQEAIWSVGVVRLIPGTGSSQLRNAGAIATVGSTAPTFYFGKGFGSLSNDALRPFAITGEVSRVFSDTPSVSPNAWTYAASLQYSMPYLQQHVKALNIPQWVTRLIPLVEVSMTAPDVGPTTGTIAPGLLYEANTWQLGAEAILPANSASRQLQGTGFLIQFHVFLDDLAWKTFWGKPIIKKDLWK